MNWRFSNKVDIWHKCLKDISDCKPEEMLAVVLKVGNSSTHSAYYTLPCFNVGFAKPFWIRYSFKTPTNWLCVRPNGILVSLKWTLLFIVIFWYLIWSLWSLCYFSVPSCFRSLFFLLCLHCIYIRLVQI